MNQPRQDEHGRARAGSQLQVQIYVNRRPNHLSEAVATAIGGGLNPGAIMWRAPLEREGFGEPMDRAFLVAVDLQEYAAALRGFWPSSGPRWDALAVVENADQRGVLLVEGKSYPEEMESTLSASAEASIQQIRESLAWAKGVLGADRTADWTQPYYQYANRLAHVAFLREQLDVPTWLVNLCFIDDPHRPTSLDEWRSALEGAGHALGFGPGAVPHCVDVFLPARQAGELTPEAKQE